MSGRPDATDRAQAADKRRARHSACLCGGSPVCTCRPLHTPSPGWRPWSWRPLMSLIFGYLQVLDQKLDSLKEEVHAMAEQTQAAVAELVKDLHRLADGYNAKDAVIAAKDVTIAAKDAEITDLRAALASADADKEAAVAAAVTADDATDAAAIADADAIVEGLSPEPAPEPAPVEEPPADGSA